MCVKIHTESMMSYTELLFLHSDNSIFIAVAASRAFLIEIRSILIFLIYFEGNNCHSF